VKFNDADLIGSPIRVSVSPRTLERGEAEVKLRTASEAFFVPLAEVLPAVRQHLDDMYAALSGDPPAA
jgi:prolyl-tRNA synthetase